MTSSFKVWDPACGTEKTAVVIGNAYDASDAAERFAENDIDGNIEGVYCKAPYRDGPVTDVATQGRLLMVRCGANGRLYKVRVGITEYEPVYEASWPEEVE
jgi:hypothetical protein